MHASIPNSAGALPKEPLWYGLYPHHDQDGDVRRGGAAGDREEARCDREARAGDGGRGKHSSARCGDALERCSHSRCTCTHAGTCRRSPFTLNIGGSWSHTTRHTPPKPRPSPHTPHPKPSPHSPTLTPHPSLPSPRAPSSCTVRTPTATLHALAPTLVHLPMHQATTWPPSSASSKISSRSSRASESLSMGRPAPRWRTSSCRNDGM